MVILSILRRPINDVHLNSNKCIWKWEKVGAKWEIMASNLLYIPSKSLRIVNAVYLNIMTCYSVHTWVLSKVVIQHIYSQFVHWCSEVRGA